MKHVHVERGGERTSLVRTVLMAVVLGLTLGFLVLAVATRLGSAIGG